MIYDLLENIGFYFDASHPIRKAVEFARAFSPSSKDGRYEIDGDKIYASVFRYETSPASERPFESHEKYIDVQVLLEGEESVGISVGRELPVTQPYDAQKDCALYQAAGDRTVLVLRPGRFAVFFPHDCHQPNCDLAGKSAVRKMVVKIAL